MLPSIIQSPRHLASRRGGGAYRTCELELAALLEEKAIGPVGDAGPAVFAVEGCEHENKVEVEELEADELGAQCQCLR